MAIKRIGRPILQRKPAYRQRRGSTMSVNRTSDWASSNAIHELDILSFAARDETALRIFSSP